MQGFAEFEFDLPKALREELIQLLDSMDTGVLDATVAGRIPEAQGVYQLFHKGTLVYIGKTDAEAGLRTRLGRHAWKMMHRPNLQGSVEFKAVQILVFTAMDLETQLIKHYRKAGAVAWNGSGFGSNDPGRERETTNKDPDGFDASYPISIDLRLEQPLEPGEVTVIGALAHLKSTLPYTLRYETLRNEKGKAQRGKHHLDLAEPRITVPGEPQTVRQIMGLIAGALGADWQATVFASHVILYKENRQYKFGKIIEAT
jgi:hypothetical protein